MDTIILQLETGKFTITDYSKFKTTKEKVLNTNTGFYKWINNPLARDKNIYKPRLTLIKRGRYLYLKIEFSAPKIIFNDNLNELEEKDFNLLIKVLQKKIIERGALIFTRNLEEAEVISFHPSKNIPLKGGYTANLVIKELSKVDVSKRFDLDKKGYTNNGEVLQIYTNAHSLVIYDKISDFKKPKKRAIDKDQTNQQLSLFDLIKSEHKQLEVLRIEARLSSKKKMNDTLKRIGYKPNPIFRNVLNKKLCQDILWQYWNDFFSDNQFIFNTNTNPQKILEIILTRYPKIKIIKAINIAGLYMLCRDDEGMRGFRQTVDSYKPKTNWAVVKRYIKNLDDEIFAYPAYSFIKDIKQELGEFNAFRLNK
jgi:hypothetical protein